MALKSSRVTALRIRVPATSANLGPGFDCLGIAVGIFNTFTVRRSNKSQISGRGTCEGIGGGENIFFSAFRRVCKLARVKPFAVEVEVDGGVPVARGLGSSATAIVAGVLAANALTGAGLTPAELLNAATEEEGHPDNVAPALLGSLVAAVITSGGVLARQYKPHRDWRIALLIPGYPLSTEKARRAIPKSMPLRDAVFNLTRVPFILDAIVRGDANQLRLSLEDRLHEPYRKHLIHGYDAIRGAAFKAGAAGVYLSGAGPTMAALCLGRRNAEQVSAAMAAAVADRSFTCEARVVAPHLKGSTVKIL